MKLVLLLCCAAVVAAQNQPVAPPGKAAANTLTGQVAGRADAARRDAWYAGPGTDNKLPMKDFAQYLNNHLAAEKRRSVVAGTSLLTTSFSSDADGWTGTTKSGASADIAWTAGTIRITSSGTDTPYFVSSSKWSGDFSAAYNGALSITTGPVSYSGSLAGGSNFDIALVSNCGYSLTMSGIFKEAVQTYKLTLNEDSGWIDSRRNKKPTIFDFNGVLANLQSIQVRASLHSASSTNTLSAVTLTAGMKWYPCCTLDDTVDICATPGSPYYNPAQLKFYCEGASAQTIRVLRVTPRFARRTGGAVITVSGQNFGLPGSRPTVRIGGLQCQATNYVNDRIEDTAIGVKQSTTLLCRSPVHRGFDHSVTVTAQSGSVEGPYQVRSNPSRTAWSDVGADATSCSSDDSHGFEFGAHDFVSVTELLNFVAATTGTTAREPTDVKITARKIVTAVDRNTGDIYTLGTIAGTANKLKTQGVHIADSNANELACAAAGKCMFLMKADQHNNPLWSAVIQGVPANDVVPWGLDIDPTGPHVFITGASDFAGATDTTVKFQSATNKVSQAPITPAFVTLRSRASNAFLAGATADNCRGFLAKYTGDTGTALWATPVCGNAATATSTEFSMLLSVYRASTSLIINTEETSDNPSESPIKGFLKDNGGVFAAGTVKVAATSDTVTFGIESSKFAADTSLDTEQKAILGGDAVQWGYVVKYDTEGRVLWARRMRATTGSPVITSVTAMGDKVYVSGYAPSGLDKIDSCTFETSKGPGAAPVADKSNNFICSEHDATLATAIPSASANHFVIAYDASGLVAWTRSFVKSATAAATASVGWGGNSILTSVSAVRGARPLNGNTAGWNSLETLLGRDQPPMGELNDNGSENFDTSISKGRFVYLAGTFGNAETLTVTDPVFPEIGAGATLTLTAASPLKTFLIKMAAQTGRPQWAQMYPPTSETTHHVVPFDLKADDITGAVYMTGTITTIDAFDNALACNRNDDETLCGVDLFGMGNARKVGCPVDPRPYLGQKGRCQTSGTLSSDECLRGLLNKEFGLPFCRFVPVGHSALSRTGFVAKISDGYTDQFRRTLNNNFGPGQSTIQATIDAVKSNVQWFKVLGNGHGHTVGSTPSADQVVHTEGHSLSIRNSDIIVAGLHELPAKTLANGRLQFPGVHSLYQNEPHISGVQTFVPGGRQTIYGTQIESLGLADGISLTAAGKGAFVALLKD